MLLSGGSAMPRTADSIGEAVANAVAVWPEQTVRKVSKRWAHVSLATLDGEPVVYRYSEGRKCCVCVCCGTRTIRKLGRGQGKPPRTCSDPICKRIRQVVTEVRRSGPIDWESIDGTARDAIESRLAS